MRPLMIGFLILSPFLAIAQSYHLQPPLPLPHAPSAHFAQHMVASASIKMTDMVRAVQALLG